MPPSAVQRRGPARARGGRAARAGEGPGAALRRRRRVHRGAGATAAAIVAGDAPASPQRDGPIPVRPPEAAPEAPSAVALRGAARARRGRGRRHRRDPAARRRGAARGPGRRRARGDRRDTAAAPGGLRGRAVRRRSSRQPRDRVVSQRPGAGHSAETGSTIEITVSDGQGIDQVPAVEGLRRSRPRQRLSDAGFKIEEQRRSSIAVDENRAISTGSPSRQPARGRSDRDARHLHRAARRGGPRPSSARAGARRPRRSRTPASRCPCRSATTRTAIRGPCSRRTPGGDAASRRGSTVTIYVARAARPRVDVPSPWAVPRWPTPPRSCAALGLRVSSGDQSVGPIRRRTAP